MRLLALVSLSAMSCSLLLADKDAESDAGAADPDASVPPDGGTGEEFGPPRALGILNVSQPELSPDELTLYFVRQGAGAEIFRSVRPHPSVDFVNPQVPDPEFSAALTLSHPRLLADDLTLYLRADGSVYASRRGSGSEAWGPPVMEPDAPATLDSFAAAADELVACFSNTGPAGGVDLFEVQSVSNTWDTPKELGGLNTDAFEGNCELTSDGLTIYFSSTRNGGTFDIFVSRRLSKNDEFRPPTPIASINTPNADETDPTISADGRTLLFVRDGQLMEATR